MDGDEIIEILLTRTDLDELVEILDDLYDVTGDSLDDVGEKKTEKNCHWILTLRNKLVVA